MGLPPCFSKHSITAVSRVPELAGGSRAGSGTVWLQMVAGRSRTGPSATGARAAGFTAWRGGAGAAWPLVEACAVAAVPRTTRRRPEKHSRRRNTRTGIGHKNSTDRNADKRTPGYERVAGHENSPDLCVFA